MHRLSSCNERAVRSGIALAFLLLALAANESDAAASTPPSAFAIEPYLYVDPAKGVTLSWAYAGETEDVIDLRHRAGAIATFVDEDGRSHRVVPAFTRGMYRATPPVFCGRQRWRYLVTGMPSPILAQPLPCPDANEVRFSFVTDTQLDLDETRPLIDKMAERDDAFTIHGGDIVDFGGAEELWLNYFSASENLLRDRPLVASAGNHDFFFDRDGENVDRFLGQAIDRRFYSFRSGPVFVVVLDSTHVNDPAFNREQLAWLEQTLRRQKEAEAGPAWTLVLFHHAVYTESFAHGFLGNFSPSPHIRLLKDYEPLFVEYAVDLVVTGHVHLLERSYKDGVQYLVGGPAGGLMGIRTIDNPYSQLSLPVRSATAFTATPTSLRFRSFDKKGTELDTYVLTKGGGERQGSRRKEAHLN